MDMNFSNTSTSYLDNGTARGHVESAMEMLLFQKIASTAVICICFFTAVVHALLLVVLKRCRKMPTALKWLSVNFVASNTLSYISLVMMCILFLTLDTSYYYAMRDLRVILAGGQYCVGCGMTAGLALERYFKLTYPYKFNRILSNMNVVIYIVSIWVISFSVPLGLILEHFVITCKSTLRLCDFSSTIIKLTIFYNSTLLFYTLLILWTVFIIRKQVHVQIMKIWKSTQVHPSTEDNMPHRMIHEMPNTSLAVPTSCDEPRDMSDTTKRDHVICIVSNDDGLEKQYSLNETKDVSHEPGDTCPNRIKMHPDKISRIGLPAESQQMCHSQYTPQRDIVSSKHQQTVSKQLFKKENFRATQNTLKIIITYVLFHVLITIPGTFITSYPEWRTATIRAYVQTFTFVCSLAGSYIGLYLYIWKFKECKMLFLITFCSWNSRLYAKGQQLKFDVYNIVTTTIKGRIAT